MTATMTAVLEPGPQPVAAPLLKLVPRPDVEPELVSVLVTMRADPKMPVFDWGRHIEELRFLFGQAVPTAHWPSMGYYGSDNGFGEGAVAITVRTTRAVVDTILAEIGQNIWFDIPVKVSILSDY